MTTFLLDANNLAMRSIHAMENSNLQADGIRTGPLLVFINCLSRHVKEEKPTRVVACWDSGGSLFREALDSGYKANRTQVDLESEFGVTKRTSFSLMREFCALAGVHQVDRLGFEADDIIAQYTRTTEGKIIILSSDKDFLQLLSPRVTQIRFSSSGTPTDFWDLERLEREIGATRMNYVHALALAGDKIDGIPGVPRFGIRTAVKQLAKCDWDIGRLLKEHEVASEHRDRVERNIALVDLLTPREDLMLPPLLPWKPTTAGDPAYEPLMNFILRYRLDSVKTKILSNTLWNA